MREAGCLFCKIVDGQVPGASVYETENLLAFKDTNPQAPVHVLVVPKRHISGVHEITAGDSGLVADLLLAANQIARQFNIQNSGYRLVINCKKEGGQTVDHLHLHVLGGRKMTWPPG